MISKGLCVTFFAQIIDFKNLPLFYMFFPNVLLQYQFDDNLQLTSEKN